jgi:FkbH-like protein
MYRQQANRSEMLSTPIDCTQMMHALGLKATFGRASKRDLSRVAELIQRTNQFNTTTVRYTKQELTPLLTDPSGVLYVASLADKFGSLGLVCVVVVRRLEDRRTIESFVMSCRAMGFGLERLVLRLVVEAESEREACFVGRFVPSGRNTPCQEFFAENGFVRVNDEEWILASMDSLPLIPPWFEVEQIS